MLPQNTLSTEPVPAVFEGGRALPVRNEVDYELGGVGLNDPSKGLLHQMWRGRIVNKTHIILDAENGASHSIISGNNITEVSFSFDRNMNPAVAYVENGVAKLYWFDSAVAAFTTTEYPNIITPRLSLDDKREAQSIISDVIFAYLKNGNLYMRQQRDRYSIEYLLAENIDSPGLIKMGMNRQLRMQFLFKNPL